MSAEMSAPHPAASDLATAEFVVRTIAETCVENEKYFCDLDSVVGDGDFGYSLARGFEQVLENWAGFDRADASIFILKIATAITSRIGGTSGPIWGTGFLRVGMALKANSAVSAADVVAALRSGVEGIKKRGNSDVGDKTLIDALVPAIDAFERATDSGANSADALRALAVAARSAAEGTSEMQAKRGRASYSGERSIGSPDAGAVAVAVLAERIADTWSSRPGAV